MRDGARELWLTFQSNDWFAKVGQNTNDKRVKSVAKWLDALKHLTSGEIETVGYLNGEALKNALLAAEMNKRWQAAEAELRPLARQIVTERIQPIRERKSWSIFVDMIADYDISYALLEKEFDDVLQPYFATKAHWYLAGHLPCGITAKGMLMVY